MMMIHQSHPTVHIPPWPLMDAYPVSDEESDTDPSDTPLDLYSSDEFRMYEFKIRRCARGRSHDWTDCPYAHPGEKARRRDPRKYHYSGTPCPDHKKGGCKKGDGCDYAHGVFECWLHPARYRTQPCKDGIACRRRVCFFAHTPDQLRVLSPRSTLKVLDSYDGSPMRLLSSNNKRSSPPMSPGSEYGSPLSPPVSPDGLALWLRKMRLGGGGGRMGVGSGSVPTTPKREALVMAMERKDFVEVAEEEEEPDFGWISELVK